MFSYCYILQTFVPQISIAYYEWKPSLMSAKGYNNMWQLRKINRRSAD